MWLKATEDVWQIPLLLLLHSLALSALEDQDLSGCLSNGQSHIAISKSGTPLQPFPLQMMKMVTQIMGGYL